MSAEEEVEPATNCPEEAREKYVAEEVLCKRVRNGFLELFIKWRGYGFDDNTWELWECLNAKPHYLSLFPSLDINQVIQVPSSDNDDGYTEMGEVEKVIGYQEFSRKFIVKWFNKTKLGLVDHEEMKICFPQTLLQYYEEQLSFLSNTK